MRHLRRDGRHGALYLGAMPGRFEPLQAFLDELERREISTVVCLAPLEEIRGKSPGYAISVANGAVPVERFRHLRHLRAPRRRLGDGRRLTGAARARRRAGDGGAALDLLGTRTTSLVPAQAVC